MKKLIVSMIRPIALAAILYGLVLGSYNLRSHNQTHEGTYERYYNYHHLIKDYYAFDPRFSAMNKYAIVSNSYLVTPYVASLRSQSKTAESIETTIHAYAYQDHVANYVLRHEYRDYSDLFVQFGQSSTDFTHQLFFINALLRVPNMKAIIYSNGRSGQKHFTANADGYQAEKILSALAILEQWRNDYPAIDDDIAAYLDALKKSDGYREALKIYGPDWRAYLEPGSFALPQKTIFEDKQQWAEWLRRIGKEKQASISLEEPIARARDALFARFTVSGVLTNSAKVSHGSLSMPEFFGSEDKKIDELLQTAKDEYLKPLKVSYPFYTYRHTGWTYPPDHRLDVLWLKIVQHVLNAHGIKLVYYFVPFLPTPEDDYRFLQDEVMHDISQLLAPYGNVVLDQTRAPEFHYRDFILEECPPGDQSSDLPKYCTDGYHPNLIGNIKRARALIKGLVNLNLLSPKNDGGPTETISLPHKSECYPLALYNNERKKYEITRTICDQSDTANSTAKE